MLNSENIILGFVQGSVSERHEGLRVGQVIVAVNGRRAPLDVRLGEKFDEFVPPGSDPIMLTVSNAPESIAFVAQPYRPAASSGVDNGEEMMVPASAISQKMSAAAPSPPASTTVRRRFCSLNKLFPVRFRHFNSKMCPL